MLQLQHCSSPCILLSNQLKSKTMSPAAACCTWWQWAAPPFKGSRRPSWGSRCFRPCWTPSHTLSLQQGLCLLQVYFGPFILQLQMTDSDHLSIDLVLAGRVIINFLPLGMEGHYDDHHIVLHVAKRNFFGCVNRLWKFFTTLLAITRLLDF